MLKNSFFIFAVVLLFFQSQAFAFSDAYENIKVSSEFSVHDSETKSIALDSARRIKNIIVQASGIGQASTIEVMVNGEVKGTIYAPGADPSYVVTIEDVARSIEFRHRSGGSMRIHDVQAAVSTWSSDTDYSGGGFHYNKGKVQSLVQQALSSLGRLKPLMENQKYTQYLFPIKKSAASVYIMSTSHGDMSKQTITALILLIDQIDYSRPVLNELMQMDEAFEDAVILLTIRESIEEMLN